MPEKLHPYGLVWEEKIGGRLIQKDQGFANQRAFSISITNISQHPWFERFVAAWDKSGDYTEEQLATLK